MYLNIKQRAILKMETQAVSESRMAKSQTFQIPSAAVKDLFRLGGQAMKLRWEIHCQFRLTLPVSSVTTERTLWDKKSELPFRVDKI